MFACNYCGTGHPLAERSKEHVVPEALGNRDMLLGDVCCFVNNFLARSFETHVVSSPFMKMVLLEFDLDSVPKKGVHFIEEFESAAGTTERLYHVDGKERLRDMPQRETTTTIQVPAFDSAGIMHSVDVMLPAECSILIGSDGGDEIECEEARAKVKKTMARALDYLQRLARNPEMDPQIAELLRANGWHLRFPTKINYDVLVERRREPRWVGDLLTKEYSFDHELWTKFYMKIAWCFACRELGRRQLIELGGELALRYLTLAVDPMLVEEAERAAPNLVSHLFREATIGDERIWFWRASITEATAVASQLPPSVRRALADRAEAAKLFGGWVQVHETGNLRRKEGGPSNAERQHRLCLTKIVGGGRAALACSIDLFGGVMSATVQLAPASPEEKVPEMGAIERAIPVKPRRAA